MRIQNQSNGNLAVGDVGVTDVLPLDQVDFVALDSNDFNCEINGGAIQCINNNILTPGEIATIEIVVEPEEEGTISNTAFVFFQGVDEPVDESTEETEVESSGNGDGNGDGNRDRFRDFLEEADILDEELLDEELSDLEEAEADLFGDETTDGEGTVGDDLNDTADEGDGVSATAEDGQAEASTPGAVASAGEDPDELEPVEEPLGDVENEIPTSGPLPNTGGPPLWLYALPLLGALVLVAAVIRRLRGGH